MGATGRVPLKFFTKPGLAARRIDSGTQNDNFSADDGMEFVMSDLISLSSLAIPSLIKLREKVWIVNPATSG